MQFDGDDPRIFPAIHRHGTLSAAARELRVNQPPGAVIDLYTRQAALFEGAAQAGAGEAREEWR